MIRLAIQQRVIPTYRAPFLELLANHPEIELGVFAGQPKEKEQIIIAQTLELVDYCISKNTHLFKGKFYVCLQPGFKKWVSDWKPDVLIVEANPRYFSTPSVIQLMKEEQKPVVGWGLGVPEYQGMFSNWRNAKRGSFLQSLDAIIAYSGKGAEQYRNTGFNPELVYVATNSTTPAPINDPPEHHSWIGVRDPIMLYVGRLQPRKKLDSLIKVCAKLPEDLQPELWIVGEGEIRGELELIAKEHYPKTTFLGEKFGDELAQIFSKADLFVLPGTGGLAVQQAMSFALPVIVAEGDGTQSDYINESNGWIIPPNDPDKLFHAIKLALSSPEKLLSMGLAGFQTVKTNVNIENMVSVFVQVCLNVLNQGRKP